jgi:hypothetical protein
MKRIFAVLSLAVVFGFLAASCVSEPKAEETALVEEADGVSDATSAATGEGGW